MKVLKTGSDTEEAVADVSTKKKNKQTKKNLLQEDMSQDNANRDSSSTSRVPISLQMVVLLHIRSKWEMRQKSSMDVLICRTYLKITKHKVELNWKKNIKISQYYLQGNQYVF